ncbi:nuclear factor erythroid 2-related factor 3 isoform X2 [Hemicordylus capensis]|uniref:nuclear factor erythroid 2-related factor 3 isoform X2 n=1 Tax=Hemicordylus capensis TaxID=884348 RepID=UPI002303EA35|nr:nuclear factor erythroid 2-related factor 3 isoform X2 [Hemicordylus capensis]
MRTPRRRERKKPRRRCCSEEDWLHLILLLSLVGLRLGPELSPLSQASDKGKLLWLRELGAPRFPAARVAVWLVHEGAETPEQPRSGGGGSSQEEAPDSGARFPGRAQRRSGEGRATGAAAPTSAGSEESSSRCPGEEEDVDFKASQECLGNHHLPEEGAHLEDEESEESDHIDWKERETTASSPLNHRSTTDSIPLEGYFPLLSSLTENALQEQLLGNIASESNGGVNLSNFHNTVDLTQAISQDVSLHDATMMGSDYTTGANAERRNLEIQETLLFSPSLTHSDLSLMNSTNLLGIFASDNCCKNLTDQDFFMGLNANRFDEVNLTPLAIEEEFDPGEVSSCFEELDSDSGLSLNLDHSNSSSFVLTCDSDAKSAPCDVLGAVGGCCLGYCKHCHMDYQSNYDLGAESLADVSHNHTYSQITQKLPSKSEHYFQWPDKSNNARSRNIYRNQSHDERRAQAQGFPFSVNDIVTLPVDSFNSMLSKYYLTDNQQSLIHDIRRRGKNKVAAHNCRKRKLDVIMNLEEDVCHLQAQKESLKKQKAQCSRSIRLIKQKLHYLYWDIFNKLRDDQGRPVNPSQYTLHCCKNGSILVLPGKAVQLEPKQNLKKIKSDHIDPKTIL